MTYILEDDTAKLLQNVASKQRHKCGQLSSPNDPALKQQQLKYP
jgi:hypothetical protein